MKKDMTVGTPWKLIILFALPLIAGNIFQQMYTVIDTMVVGQVLGVSALAALGAIDWFNWMIVSLVQGLTQGFGIHIANKFGEKDEKGLSQSIINSFVLSMIISIILMVLSQSFVNFVLFALKVPMEIQWMSKMYLRIIFAGIPISVVYNILSVILRSLGNSRSPFVAIIISTISNIILDIILVVYLQKGIAGAAIATLIAQLISAGYCFVTLRKMDMLISIQPLNYSISKTMLKLGLPMASQNVIIALGGMVIQSFVDTYGVIFMAGYIATSKMYGLLECAAIALGYAIVTYVGQNMGAEKEERVISGVKASLILAICFSFVISAIMITFGKSLLSLFITGSKQEVVLGLRYAYDFLFMMSVFLPALYILHILRSTLQGMGNTVSAMISGIFELIFRVGSAFILPIFMKERGLFFAEVMAWIGADLILIFNIFKEMKKCKFFHKLNV